MVIDMRHFYIFNINNNFVSIDKTHPYALFKLFLDLYNSSNKNYIYVNKIYNSIIKPINKYELSDNIYNSLCIDESYTRFINNHYYNNYFNNEESKLIINNSYLKVDSNNIKPIFFKYLNKISDLFVCDFDNNDYFYLENIA